MEFRPCVDIHDGKVKQIVGSSLRDGEGAKENFVSSTEPGFYGKLYKEYGLYGGHIILLNKSGTEEYAADLKAAKAECDAFPGGFQIGGGVTAENAKAMLDMGASHVIVTSYVFEEGEILYDRLEKLVSLIGKEHIVIDLSCRKRDEDYYVVTNRWQKFTQSKLTPELFENMSKYCDEFLVHAVDVEGKNQGIEAEVVRLLADVKNVPVTYAGGIKNLDDVRLIKELGRGQVNITIGTAMRVFGGSIEIEDVLSSIK